MLVPPEYNTTENGAIMKYIWSALIVGALFFSAQSMASATCKDGNTLIGRVKIYGLDSSGKYMQIHLTAIDGTEFQLSNKTYPIDTDLGKAIDKIVMLAYISGSTIMLHCQADNQFDSVGIYN